MIRWNHKYEEEFVQYLKTKGYNEEQIKEMITSANLIGYELINFMQEIELW